ncbi:MAG: 2-hydroxymuconate tautomerase family protein [Pseudomonadota bacterium]
MAIVTLTILEGRSLEIKDKVIEGITKVLTEHIDPDPSHIRVMINEISADNYAVGGRRISKPKS